jgi:hypothetical protein
MPTSRGWLKIHGYMVVVCMVFTLVIGLDIWFETLKTRENLSQLWNRQPNSVQSLLQQEVSPSYLLLHIPSLRQTLPISKAEQELTYKTAQLLRLPKLNLSPLRPRHSLP